MNTTPSDIGTRIRDARKAAGMSQTVLGQHLNKTLRTIQKYESGKIEPSIATINELAKILHVSSAELMGYKRQEIRLESVKRPPNAEGWTCSLTFDGNDQTAEHNPDLCLFLERFAEERERVETYWTDQAYFDRWFDQELAYYAGVKLPDKEQEDLTPEERLKRRNELIGHIAEETE